MNDPRSYITAVNLIDRYHPGMAAKMYADFIAEHVPHDPESDDYYVRQAHATLLWLCETLDREGLPRPFSMRT